MNPDTFRLLAAQIERDNRDERDFQDDIYARLQAITERLDALETPVPTPVPPPVSDPVDPSVLTFNYPVARDESPAPFLDHGWDFLKSTNNGNMGAFGHIYTVDSNQIPNYRGPDLGKWVAFEGLSSTRGTDFYLQKGNNQTQRLPANLEMIFTICVDGPLHSDKLIYPTYDGYPASGSSYGWLIDIRTNNFGWLGAPYDVFGDPLGDCYLMIEGTGMKWHKAGREVNGQFVGDSWWKMMHTNPVPIRRGVPTEVKIQIDTSGTRNVGGTIDVFLREPGEEWVNVIHAHHGEEIDGHLFEWILPRTDGMQAIRIPTTQGMVNTKYFNKISFGEIA